MIVFYIKERFAKTHPKRNLFEHNLDDNDDDDGDDNLTHRDDVFVVGGEGDAVDPILVAGELGNA